ncbi:MAG TPA: WD40 repeat domain-containing protein [Isosphaeraceae bacterium]|jgi:WD40 repeat protein
MSRGAANSQATLDSIGAVAVSPDGQLVAGGGRDTTVRLWDARSGTLVRTLRGHDGEVVALAFAPDGAALASGDFNHVVNLWDLRTGALQRTLKGRPAYRLNALGYSRDGRTLAVGDQVGQVTLWDAGTGTVRRTLDGHGSPVQAVAFAPDDATLAVGGWDKALELRDARTGEVRASLEHGGIVWSVAFAADGSIATASEVGKVRLWNARTGALRATLIEHDLPIRFVAASPDGRLVAAMTDSEVKLWDARTGAQVQAPTEGAGSLRSLAFSPDGRLLVGGGGGGTKAIGFMRAWDVPTGAVRWEATGHLQRVVSVAFAPDGETIAGGIDGYQRVETWHVESGHVQLWDARTGAMVRTLAKPDARTLAGSGNWVTAVAFAPDGRSLAIARDDQTIGLWDAETGQEERSWRGPEAAAVLAFAPDGKAVVGGHRGSSPGEGAVILWDAASGAELWRQAVPRSSITAVAFAPDGSRIATGSLEHRHAVGGPTEVRLWDARTGRPEWTIEAGPGGARALAFAPDGATLAGAFQVGPARQWDVATGTLRRTLEGHPPGWVAAVAFAPDGTMVASASFRQRYQLERPGEVRLWDAPTGALRRKLTADGEPASSAAFSPDLTRLAIGRDDGTLTVLHLDGGHGR